MSKYKAILSVIGMSILMLSACGKQAEPEAEPEIRQEAVYVPPQNMSYVAEMELVPEIDLGPMMEMENPIDFDEWWEQDKNVYAYIEVPNTRISYPILQSDDTQPEDYYLEHNVDGSYGYPGCIYTQRLNSKDFDDYNTVMYGHNMNNGTGFHDLHKFRDSEFFDENRFIYIYTPDEILIYKTFGAYIFTNAHILYTYDFSNEDGFQSYLYLINSYPADNYDHSIEPTTDDRILTLATCTNSESTRLLVQAKLMYRAACPYGESGEVPELIFSEEGLPEEDIRK